MTIKKRSIFISTLLAGTVSVCGAVDFGANTLAEEEEGYCDSNPLEIVFKALTCIESNYDEENGSNDSNDPVCAANSFHADFVATHNGVVVQEGAFPQAYFEQLEATFVIKFAAESTGSEGHLPFSNIALWGIDSAHARYIQSFEHRTSGATFDQHEDVFFKVQDCKILRWDQVGDQAEQDALKANM